MDIVKEFPQIEEVLKDIPESGIIELKTVYWKDQSLLLFPTKSKVTKKLLGIPSLSTRDREKINYCPDGNSSLLIVDGFEFDLSKVEDRLNWAWVKESPMIAESFDEAQNTPGCSFYVSDEEAQLKNELEFEEDMYKALDYIHKDKDEERVARARLLGVDMTGEPKAAKKYLLSVVKEGVEGVKKILRLYTSSVTAVTLAFFKAVDKGVIKQTNGVYMLGTLPLGHDDETVINYLQAPSNAAVLDEIKRKTNPELYEESASTGKSGSRVKKADK